MIGGSAGGDVVLHLSCFVMRFYTSAVEVNLFSCVLWQLHSLPSLPLCGKYVVIIMVPLFFGVTVPGGCHSQGCHGYPTSSALLLVAPPSFQGQVPKLTFC